MSEAEVYIIAFVPLLFSVLAASFAWAYFLERDFKERIERED